MAQMVSYMCRLLMTRYSGMIPPLKNMVKVNRNMMTRRPGKSIRESAYPAGMVQSRATAVPTTVYFRVLPYPVHRGA